MRRSVIVLLIACAGLASACAPGRQTPPERTVPAAARAPARPAAPAWRPADYARFDHRQFVRYPPANARIDPERMDVALLNAAVFYETNRQRALNGRKPFRHSAQLERSALEHSRDMVRRSFFSHKSPVAGKEEFSARIRATGFTYSTIAENIAIGIVLEYEPGRPVYTPQRQGGSFRYTANGPALPYHTYLGAARALLKGWMNSPGHRANILNPELTHLGAGGAIYVDDGIWYKLKFTQNFGTPRG